MLPCTMNFMQCNILTHKINLKGNCDILFQPGAHKHMDLAGGAYSPLPTRQAQELKINADQWESPCCAPQVQLSHQKHCRSKDTEREKDWEECLRTKEGKRSIRESKVCEEQKQSVCMSLTLPLVLFPLSLVVVDGLSSIVHYGFTLSAGGTAAGVCVCVCVCVEAGQISRASQDILSTSYPFNIQTRLLATDLYSFDIILI